MGAISQAKAATSSAVGAPRIARNTGKSRERCQAAEQTAAP